MPRSSQAARDKLLARKAQIEARLQKMDARTQEQARADDTRRKILFGAHAMNVVERHPEFARIMREELERGLTRPIDRRLFGLADLAPDAGKSSPAESFKAAVKEGEKDQAESA